MNLINYLGTLSLFNLPLLVLHNFLIIFPKKAEQGLHYSKINAIQIFQIEEYINQEKFNGKEFKAYNG